MSLWILLSACQPVEPPTQVTVDSDDPTPDTADSAVIDTIAGEYGTVLLTEVATDSAGEWPDEDGEDSDWVELYNPGPEPVALSGWSLSDDAKSSGWRFPAVTLAVGELRVVFASGKDRDDPGGSLHTDFRLSADGGETLTLSDPGGAVVDALVLPALSAGYSFGRSQDVVESILVADGDEARLSVSASGGWQADDFDDASWSVVTLPVGFSVGEAAVVEVAAGRETSQSSDGYGYTGAQAVDGSLDTFSHTGDGDLSPRWQVDLDDARWISEIVLENRRSCCADRLYNLTVSVLDADGSATWTSEVLNPTAEGATPQDPGETLTLTLDSPVSGHAVSVEKSAVNGAGSSEWMSLAEVTVYATEAAPYGDQVATDLSAEMFGISDTAALRIPLTWGGAAPSRLVLSVETDSTALGWLSDAPVETLLPPDALTDGAVLAIEGVNQSIDDPDFFLRPTLTAQDITTGDIAWFTQPTPGAPNGTGYFADLEAPLFSAQRGFYEAPISLTLTPPDGTTLAYTTDGSTPSEGVGTNVEGPVTLSVETTAAIRAMVFQEGALSSRVATHTYLFLADVVRQPAAPDGFPTTWDGLSQDAVGGDYEMDPEVVDDPAYAADLLAGLRDIPTLSIVTDPEDLFGEEAGIYVHSLQRGDAWERAVSLELILPDGSTGFATTSGLRMHGYGWRYHSNTLKHSLRLEFRSEYGPSKLEYPLFVDAPVDRFDSIVLRSQGSRGWQDFRDPEQAQYIRDAFARDTAADMGKADGHAAYVHLYLNGLYWGLYMPVERPDADFAAERFGGEAEEYDAINRRTSTNEAIDGDLVAYEEMLALADTGLSDDAGLVAIQAYLNLEDLIDYMLIHQYTVNRDGPEEYDSNNMRGARKREDGAQFRFFVWDMEYSIWDADDDYNIDVDVSGSISHVYTALRENADFRTMYSDRATLHLTEGGALTPAECTARWEARAEEIERAIVAESARWGDTDRDTPYTRDVEWTDERERLLDEFFPYRTDILIDQLTDAGLMEP
ncbi:MAG: hypothetical protein ACI8RZ_006151 [Myxococcota bacterium]|jgi:hypothetical protein